MESKDIALIISALVSVAGAITALLNAAWKRQEMPIDAAAKLMASSGNVLETLQANNVDLRQRNRYLEQQVFELQRRIIELEAEVVRLKAEKGGSHDSPD